jgi:hypothetical protein
VGIDVAACRAAFEQAERECVAAAEEAAAAAEEADWCAAVAAEAEEAAALRSMVEGWGLSAAGVAAICAARPPAPEAAATPVPRCPLQTRRVGRPPGGKSEML